MTGVGRDKNGDAEDGDVVLVVGRRDGRSVGRAKTPNAAGIVGRTRVIFRVLLHVYIDGRWRAEGGTQQAELLKDKDEVGGWVRGLRCGRQRGLVDVADRVPRHYVFELRILSTN